MAELMRHIIDLDALPEMFPTHKHEPMFWESLGRAVATFGFLEETLGKAIFAFTATKPYSEEEIHKAYENWLPKLLNALFDQLGNLIESYGKAVREHPDATIENLDELLEQLKKAAKIRNVICHGSWRSPNAEGASVPFFVNRQLECFETAIDIPFLLQLQKHVSELICAVIDTVTHMGWQFPGAQGPGTVIWKACQ
jgi:thymidylate synthase